MVMTSVFRIEMEVFCYKKKEDRMMEGYQKYKRRYFLPPEPCMDWARKEYARKTPQWCGVDLQDGNQALIIPMSLDEKIEFFSCL